MIYTVFWYTPCTLLLRDIGKDVFQAKVNSNWHQFSVLRLKKAAQKARKQLAVPELNLAGLLSTLVD